MLKRLFDIVSSVLVLLVLFPVLLIVSIFIMLDSCGGVFYRQQRVGKNARPFMLIKFRTMYTGSDKHGLLTVGGRDKRITRMGYFMRRFKIDEIPQLINVIIGDMSVVGPRPEVPKYVRLYSEEQRQVLNVRPGLTDPASMSYLDENKLLAESPEPEKTYLESVMPAKLFISLEYIDRQSFLRDVVIIFKTLWKIVK